MGSSLMSCLKYRQQDYPEQNQEAAWQELEHLAANGKMLLFVDNVGKYQKVVRSKNVSDIFRLLKILLKC